MAAAAHALADAEGGAAAAGALGRHPGEGLDAAGLQKLMQARVILMFASAGFLSRSPHFPACVKRERGVHVPRKKPACAQARRAHGALHASSTAQLTPFARPAATRQIPPSSPSLPQALQQQTVAVQKLQEVLKRDEMVVGVIEQWEARHLQQRAGAGGAGRGASGEGQQPQLLQAGGQGMMQGAGGSSGIGALMASASGELGGAGSVRMGGGGYGVGALA